MKECTVASRDEQSRDVLTELLRRGATELLREAVEAEVEELLSHYRHVRTLDGRQAVVRNGYLPKRTIQTGIGSLPVQVPKVRDRTGSGIKFTSRYLPPYLRRTQSVEELLPWLYLKGVSTGDFSEALSALLGESAAGLSSSVICRLKSGWIEEYEAWSKRSLEGTHYVYMWADAVYFPIRGESSRECMLVVIGATESGRKELVSIQEGFRESKEGWLTMLRDLKSRGLKKAPACCIADGALGFWNALRDVYPKSRRQRCWQHKINNVLDKLPSELQGKARHDLKNIQIASTKAHALRAWSHFIKTYQAKYPGAVECLEKNREEMLTFFDFPAEHWIHIRTTNVVESVFATVRLRTAKTRNCVSRKTILCLVYKLTLSAEKRWRKIRGFRKLKLVIKNTIFKDGIEVKKSQNTLENAA